MLVLHLSCANYLNSYSLYHPRQETKGKNIAFSLFSYVFSINSAAFNLIAPSFKKNNAVKKSKREWARKRTFILPEQRKIPAQM
jgi:hypothetical protein